MVQPVPPPVTVIVSPDLYKEPSLDKVNVLGIPVTVALTNLSSSVLSVPDISWPSINVPNILSSFKVNSVTSVPLIVSFTISSTIAVASFTLALNGLSACVIVCPTRFDVSFVPVVVALKIFFMFHLPSETWSICSLGNVISAFSLNNNLKNNLCPSFEPFERYKLLTFLTSFLLSTPVAKLSGIVFKNSFLNCPRKSYIVVSIFV